ncbi:MAG: NUDIX hydrolase [Planctomycetes bacterium]|nr:NUDIX hydrolase [Planctomycetota bacterium]MBI3848042.1 NUDIX hydrolase [Planctomycetota bacterium]
MTEPWRKLATHPIGHFKVFSLRRDEIESPRTGTRHDFFVLEAGPWVNVVPITPDGEIVLIEQYRHGIGEVTLEIPGGMVDPDESPMQAAGRELLEETGYRAEMIVSLGKSHPNPAILNNVLYTYLGAGAKKVAEPKLEAGEDISVVTYRLDELTRLVREGKITHSLVLAAFHFLSLQESR